jgi:methionyl aminopeptidase
MLMQEFDVPYQYQNKFQEMSVCGRYVAECLRRLEWIIVPGITTKEIEDYVKLYADNHDLVCAPYKYKNFPAHCCTSVNHEICHAIPGNKVLREGYIVKVDITFIRNGWFADACRTYYVGDELEFNAKIQRLVHVTERALSRGIMQAKAGNTIGDISRAVQEQAETNGFSVVRDYVGHGIGTEFHMPPTIPNYLSEEVVESTRRKIMVGDTFTIEPMINEKRSAYKVLADGWTVVTRDRGFSAQFEDTIGVTNSGNVVFTR